MLGGMAGVLVQWIEAQNERQKRIEEFCLFLHKFIFQMEAEKMRVVDYFAKYYSRDSRITETLHEVSRRLNEHVYPSGQMVWESVCKEMEWNLEEEVCLLILASGNGFFGRNRDENISFLKKQLEELERQNVKCKERYAKERKVWIPVGMLSGVMLILLFL